MLTTPVYVEMDICIFIMLKFTYIYKTFVLNSKYFVWIW